MNSINFLNAGDKWFVALHPSYTYPKYLDKINALQVEGQPDCFWDYFILYEKLTLLKTHNVRIFAIFSLHCKAGMTLLISAGTLQWQRCQQLWRFLHPANKVGIILFLGLASEI